MFLFVLARLLYRCFIILVFTMILGRNTCYSTRISITRTNDSLDVFTIEQSNCNEYLCLSKRSIVHKSALGLCSCRCQSNASSFVLEADLTNSICMNNVALRLRSTLGQCKLLLGSDKIDSPISVIDLSRPGSILLTGLDASSACSVYQQEFLDNGTWSVISAVGNLTTFTLNRNLLKWANVTGSRYIARIIRIHLHCDASTFCVLLKVQGTRSYNISTGYQAVAVSSTSIALHPSPTTNYLGPTVPQLTSSSTTTGLTPLETSSISPTLATVVIVTSSAILIDTRERKAALDKCEPGAWVFCQRLYLVIAATGTIILVAVIIILLCFVCIRRTRRRILHHQKPVFFQPGISKEIESSTELALIEDVKPGDDEKKGPSDEELLYQNVPRRDKPSNQECRPLKISDGQESPTTPISLERFDSGSSTHDLFLYGDKTDSCQLIKTQAVSKPTEKRFKSFCPSPVIKPKALGHLSRQVALDTEGEVTYEIMETKPLPPGSRKTNSADEESIAGIENQVFEDDEKRQSHYETIPTEERLDYENMNGACTEEQTNYETKGDNVIELGLNNQQPREKKYPDFNEEQVNYETMDNYCKEQPNYEIVDEDDIAEQLKKALFYEKMESHHDDKTEEEMEDVGEYDIPATTENEDDQHYDIPELSLNFEEEQDEPDYHYVVNRSGAGLAEPSEMKTNDENDGHGADYIYANVPEVQADTLRKILNRNSWHSREQEAKEGHKLANKAADGLTGVLQRPSSWNTTTAGRMNEITAHEDSEELYTLPDDFPKPIPPHLLEGRSSPHIQSSKTKDLNQNQSFSNQSHGSANTDGAQQVKGLVKQRTNDSGQTSDAVSVKPCIDKPKTTVTTPKKSHKPQGKRKGKSSFQQLETSREASPEGRIARTPDGKARMDKSSVKHLEHSREASPDGRKTKKAKPTVDRPQHPGMKGKAASKKGNGGSLKPEDGYSSPKEPRKQPSKEKSVERRQQPSNIKKKSEDNERKTPGDEQIQPDETWPTEGLTQPLYTNLVEMENDLAPLSANQSSTHDLNVMDNDQQPLYQNIGEIVNRVG